MGGLDGGHINGMNKQTVKRTPEQDAGLVLFFVRLISIMQHRCNVNIDLNLFRPTLHHFFFCLMKTKQKNNDTNCFVDMDFYSDSEKKKDNLQEVLHCGLMT